MICKKLVFHFGKTGKRPFNIGASLGKIGVTAATGLKVWSFQGGIDATGGKGSRGGVSGGKSIQGGGTISQGGVTWCRCTFPFT